MRKIDGQRDLFAPPQPPPRTPLTSPIPEPTRVRPPDAFDILADHLGSVSSCQTPHELADADVMYWRRQLEAMPTPANRTTAKILTRSRRLMFEAWIRDAAHAGWCERSVWGYGGPKAKADHGLGIALAATSPRDSLTVVSITADDAVVVTARGTRVRLPRQSGHAPIWCAAT